MEIYGKAPHHNEVPMYFVKFLYVHFVKGIAVDFSSYRDKRIRGRGEVVIIQVQLSKALQGARGPLEQQVRMLREENVANFEEARLQAKRPCTDEQLVNES